MSMKLKEAIERVGDLSLRRTAWDNPKSFSACRLLIEAGKRIQAKRLDHWVLITPPLPGETPE